MCIVSMSVCVCRVFSKWQYGYVVVICFLRRRFRLYQDQRFVAAASNGNPSKSKELGKLT